MSDEAKGFEVTKTLREARDAAMDAWAKATLQLTSSHEYQRLSSAISKPMLLATALWRQTAESVMSELLARFHMPSREEVLSLSQRLTRIEMVLDDLGAGLDQLRRSGGARPPRPAARERELSKGDALPGPGPAAKEA